MMTTYIDAGVTGSLRAVMSKMPTVQQRHGDHLWTEVNESRGSDAIKCTSSPKSNLALIIPIAIGSSKSERSRYSDHKSS